MQRIRNELFWVNPILEYVCVRVNFSSIFLAFQFQGDFIRFFLKSEIQYFSDVVHPFRNLLTPHK